MHRYFSGFTVRLAVLSCFPAIQSSFAEDLPSLDVIAGKALFEKSWISAPASTAASDGLGPLFNARSCSACHQEGGRGDSIETLSFVTDDPVYGEFLQTRAIQGLRAEGQVNVAFQTRVSLLKDGTEVILHEPQYEAYGLQYGALSQRPSARIAPSLQGLGLLEQVPEAYLELLADPDDVNADGISGRISKVPQHGSNALVTGRFGWKAETASLEVQVARAFRLDIGLGTALFPSPFGDCTDRQPDCLQRASGNSPESSDPEVSETISKLVITYLKSLEPVKYLRRTMRTRPGPGMTGDRANAELRYADISAGTDRESAPEGFGLFVKAGCTACHLPAVPTEAGVINPFTDLLLHDMGPGLAAESAGSAEAPEWRTAPLWGLSSARSYLHDGRARTLPEAILWHGGEADSAVQAWSALTAAEREILHKWLLSL